MPSNNRKEMQELLHSAESRGGRLSKTRSGHWCILSPFGGPPLYFSDTPGTTQELHQARNRLKKVGLYGNP